MDVKPFIVKYKAGLDRSIKPGVHGRFVTHEEALRQARVCSDFFNRLQPKSAVVGIVVDEVQLRLQKEQMEDEDPEVGAKQELSENEMLRAEIARLRAKIGDEECEDPPHEDSGSTSKRANTKRSLATSSTSGE
jgi:regulator of replication initiation timing